MYATIALIIITLAVSYKGFKDQLFLEKFSFKIDKLKWNKEYYRLVTSGLLHVSWLHLIVNMFVLYAFGSGLEVALGVIPFLVIYLTSLVGGNLLAMLIHKHSSHYSSVGASGAISGLVFATIALFPQLKILFIPGWVFGIAYVAYTIYAIRSQRTDIGHAAHLGGALIGMVFALIMFPNVLVENWLQIIAIFLPAVALIFIMIYRPDIILINKADQARQFTVEDHYNKNKQHSQQEIDRILEKINHRGIKSLSKKEKELLDQYSKL